MSFDRTNAADLASLKDEVINDPGNLGYAAVQAETAKLLDLLNLPESNTNPADQVGIPFDEYPLVDVIDEIVNAEYNGLNEREKVIVNGIINAGICYPDLKFGHIKKSFKKAFGVDSTTWANVKDDRQRQASRAEILFGRDTVIGRDDWFAARDS